ncbi:MAG: sugar-binding domain-containing protein [Sporomusaceae bacterium]|nr:sugar-binding domain-containing protein [Sporomusaceae bacterium]
MKKIVQIHRKIAPELIAVIEERYHILRHIQYAQPIGRRALAGLLDTGERIIRAQVDFLKNAGLLDFSSLGMTVTAEGQQLIADLSDYIRLVHGLTPLEEELEQSLALEKVMIIPGDAEQDHTVLKELGRAAATLLAEKLKDGMIVGVCGGSTMSMVAESITFSRPNSVVVPARGGLGEQVELQANTIAAVMAAKLGGSYRMLHIPDGIHESALEVILANDPQAKEIRALTQHTNVLLHSIGQADAMARRRKMDPAVVAELLEKGAVGEALGHFCTLSGEIVYATSSVGLHLGDLAGIDSVIAVAGGASKAEAVIAVARASRTGILVIDEAAAKVMQMIIHNKK